MPEFFARSLFRSLRRTHLPSPVMRIPSLIFLFVTAIWAVGIDADSVGAATPQGTSLADTSAVAFVAAFVEAVDARDSVVIRASIVDDGRFAWLEDGAVQYRTVDSLLQGLADFPAGVGLNTALSGLTAVPLHEGSALVYGEFATEVRGGDTPYRFRGAITVALENRGGWRVVGGHTSTGSGR